MYIEVQKMARMYTRYRYRRGGYRYGRRTWRASYGRRYRRW